MKPLTVIALMLLATSTIPGILFAQAPGEVEQQVPAVEAVEKPDLPSVDEAQGNAEARMPRVQPGGGVQQPQVEVPPAPQQPKVQKY